MRWTGVVAVVAGWIFAGSIAGQQNVATPTLPGARVVDTVVPSAIGVPDLAPYRPSGWDAPVVVSSTTETHSQTLPIPSGATAYLDFAVVNQGDAATSVRYYHRIYVDDVLVASYYTDPSHNPGDWVYVQDRSLGVLTDGLHTVRLVIDATGVIAESNETNNEYELKVGVGATNLRPYQPVGWDDSLVLSTESGTSTDAGAFTTSDTIYVDWAALNTGPGGVPIYVSVTLWLDGVPVAGWSAPRLNPNAYTWFADHALGPLASGGHTLRLVIDPTNLMPESDEFDNEYTRAFVVFDTASPRIYVSPTTLTFGSTGSSASSSAVATQGAPSPGPAPATPARFVDPNAGARRNALREKAEKNGFVRVIVRLDGSFAPEGKLAAAAVQEQRRDIHARQERVLEALQAAGTRVKRFETIPFFAAELDAKQMAMLEHLPDVLDVVEDLAAPPQMASSNGIVHSPIAWAAGFDATGRAVAVLDTGVSATHPFFATGPNKIVAEACYSSDTSVSTSLCPGGAPASTQPGSGTNCPASILGCDHGTHVAGSVAGNDYTGPNFGVGRGADIVAMQVFSRFGSDDQCGPGMAPCALTYASDVIRALERVLALHGVHPIAAVNLSFGFGHYSSRSVCDSEQAALKAAIDNLYLVGIATVAATGNDGSVAATSAPACISNVVAVSATTDADTVPSFANVASWVALVAPGTSITSSVPGGGVAEKSGTSMAAPHVAGAWAIMKQAHPDWEYGRILNELRESAISIQDTRDSAVAKDLRRLDIGAAALGTAKGFQIRNFGGTTLNVAAITAETPVAWVTWSPTGPISIPSGGVVQVRVSVNLAIAPLGLSVTRLLVSSNDTDASPYPDGVFILVDRDPVPAAPSNVEATGASSGAVSVTWNAVGSATNYHVYRSSNGTSWTMVGSSVSTSFIDDVVLANHAYLYKVRSYAMVESADSNRDLATTVAFMDPAILGIPVRVAHWSQLLTAVNAVRAMTGLPPAAFTAPAPATGVTIRRQHLLDLRTALAPARSALGLPAVSYTDPAPVAGVTTIKAAHVTELRTGVR